MKKLLLAFSILGAGAISLAALHQITARAHARHATRASTLTAVSNRLAELQSEGVLVENELAVAKRQWAQADAQPMIRADWLAALEGQTSGVPVEAWSDLRQQLQAGWDSSPDYVLVNKRVLKRIGIETLNLSGHLTKEAAAVLAISPEEKSRITAAVDQAKDEQVRNVTRVDVQRAEPQNDVLAQYTITPTEPAMEQTISNSFSAQMTAILGSERAEIFLEDAWRRLRSQGPTIGESPVTMTLRRSNLNGEPKLICELREGTSVRTSEVRYGVYPSPWFLSLFPGGWEPLAQRDGFALPPDFKR
jgi:hypothetical protein